MLRKLNLHLEYSMYKYIIVGAGFAGSVIAERIANVFQEKVLLIEKRNHIGGNCYDYYDKNGVLVHKYGPHIFHTELKHVWEYISSFTDWNNYQHRVLGFIDGKNVPIPFNLRTLHELFPPLEARNLEEKLTRKFGLNVKIPIMELTKYDDPDIQLLADYIYKKIFLNYTKKQWGMKPEDLDPSVTARIPVFISMDDRYFQDKYQGIPAEGYTVIFEKMLSNPLIDIKLETDYQEIIKIKNNTIKCFDEKFEGQIIFTGEIDKLFDYKFGKLPYRSLTFEMENLSQNYFQDVGTVNYPNDHHFTRITEFKHLTGQKIPTTTISKEYPHDYNPADGDIPYYPIPKAKYVKLYEKYQAKSREFDNLILLGRLAEYKYYNMDMVIDRALTVFKEKFYYEK